MLAALDADVLAAHACWFGGGTAVALRYGEYRESVDIDFMVSDLAGYRALRQRLTGPAELGALACPGATLV
ncbi:MULTISPECIES: nucleotidyl transferase AbiEii/AbiGii toxin family protein [Roseateles]|uniref:nucleotidyl transferase AbiEii/AbiGii toxin family protein n=1 Tax=Roseateles TaxID=93681 RepID=UPI002DFDFD90|nr:nucleotidyl transferase AbiEii/AbiGii toxin family protein [Roseateles sp.]